ncbi:MAG: long-chain fatty acid--CoA ligase, partial [Gammaproteobacteria bacterium]|nr:long-chain fatty acid--CoA ligase [Gammaproteobacteria bacterium]
WASLLPTLAAGGTSVVMPGFRAEEFWDAAARHEAKLTLLVPTQYAMLLESEPPAGFDRIECPIIGGAKADRALIERLMSATGGRLVEQLGSTETEAICCLPSNAPREKWGSAGIPLAGVTVKVLGADDCEVPAGETGEIVVHSSSLMTGYHGWESDEAAFWNDSDSGRRYYRTCDMGTRDRDGYLWVRGRSTDLIIAAGHNVYPSDIEAVLLQHPAVRRAAVVGAPSRVLGEVPIAFVEPAAPRLATESELCSWLNARLSDKQRVYRVRLIDRMPINSSGKILKVKLHGLARSAPRASPDSAG